MRELRGREELLLEIENLCARLAEAEETLHAIRSGEVDALVVTGTHGEQVFTLKGAEQPYRTLIEEMNEGAVMLAADDTVLYCNQGFARLLRTPLEKIIGSGIADFVPPAFKPVFEKILLQGRKESSKGETAFLASDGTPVPVHLSVNILHMDGVSTVCLVAMDLTEHKRLEMQLLRAQRMESIGTLASGIAHDLNNVLTPIMLSLQIMRTKFTDEQSQKLLTMLEKNSQRGANLIKQVLSFARGIEGERNILQITHLVYDIEKIIKETFPRTIQIRTDLQKDLWTISGDATQLHQVIMNLCVNARDAMPDGGILGISAGNVLIGEDYARINAEAKAGPYIIVSISDTGTGISPEILNRIFEPFFTTKEFGKGTGLGLSTSLGIVKSHGGFIDVSSKVGKGTDFRIYLPASANEVNVAEAQQPVQYRGDGEAILVVDDEASIRDVAGSILEKNGYMVILAENGVEAVSLYEKNGKDIDAVLMDMMMPAMDGQSCIRALRKINPNIKVIAASGLAEKVELTKNSCFHAFLQKPFTEDTLMRTLYEVLSAE